MASFTRKAIIQSFIRQILIKPVDKVTVKDIVEDCGISRNTFYYHFKDVYQVLEELLDLETQRVIHKIESGEGDGEAASEELALNGIGYMLENREMLYRLYRSARTEEVKKYFSKATSAIFKHVVEVRSRGIDASEEDKDLIARFYWHAFEGCLIDWVESGMQTSFLEERERLTQLFDGDLTQALIRSAEHKKKKLKV